MLTVWLDADLLQQSVMSQIFMLNT